MSVPKTDYAGRMISPVANSPPVEIFMAVRTNHFCIYIIKIELCLHTLTLVMKVRSFKCSKYSYTLSMFLCIFLKIYLLLTFKLRNINYLNT